MSALVSSLPTGSQDGRRAVVEGLDPRIVRRSMAPEIYDVVIELHRRGWQLRRQGHGWRMYCPCGDRAGQFVIPHTPPSPGNVARRMRRNAELCPGAHELMR